jgi:hypothetical protein
MYIIYKYIYSNFVVWFYKSGYSKSVSKKTPSDGTHMYNHDGSWVKRMENFEEIKEKFVEYPRVNKALMPDKINDFYN